MKKILILLFCFVFFGCYNNSIEIHDKSKFIVNSISKSKTDGYKFIIYFYDKSSGITRTIYLYTNREYKVGDTLTIR